MPHGAVPLLALFLLAGAPRAGEPGTLTIETPRGALLQATHDRPREPNGAAVVLAPGRGYRRGLPLLQESAAALAAAGFHAVRFDWAFFTAKGQPSEDLSKEIEDLDAAIGYARGIEGVRRVILAGKSLGSIAALLRASARSDDLAGLVLLTFPLHDPADESKLFPESERLAALKLPTAIITGDDDAACRLKPLYALAARCAAPPSIVIVPGDHSFKEGEDAAKAAANVRFAAQALASWARRRAG
ncbi:MAG: alpha/beta fold hydrolase [Planctomycetaceae bacterium]